MQSTVSNNLAILSFSFVPTTAAFELFAYTPTFVPTPSCCPHKVIMLQVEDFLRKLQWRFSIPFTSDPPRFGLKPSGAWPPSNLVPSHARQITQRIFHGVRSLLKESHSCHFQGNVSCDPSHVFNSIQDAGSTVCTADKGGRWTIVPSQSYHREAMRQLSNTDFYSEILQNSRTDFTAQRILQCLRHLRNKKFISLREFRFLSPPASPIPRRFRLLPKLHKPTWSDPTMPPGRPIISDTGSVTRNAGEIIEFFLKPLCAQLPSHLKDTRHLIAVLRDLVLPASTTVTLFTLDVESLYTNVPIQEGIHAVSSMFSAHHDPKRPDKTLLTLLELILSSNTFHYGTHVFRQCHGVAMGQIFGGSFANVFLGDWENKSVQSFPLKPHTWLRFQDDIFGVWTHSVPVLLQFVAHLNSCHPSIKVKLTHGSTVDFLDLTITCIESRISYQPFFKETASHMILTPSSHHPVTTYSGLLFGEALRLATNSSSRDVFSDAFHEVSSVWRRQGFSRCSIRQAKHRLLKYTGQLEFWPTGTFMCNASHCNVCPFVKETSTFKCPHSHLRFPITSRLSCSSTNTIYVIECQACSKMYVGETSRPLRERISEHLRDIRTGSECQVHKHFRDSCAYASFSFFAIASHPKTEVRRAKEAKWIGDLQTHFPSGLNTKHNDLAPKTNLILPYSACAARVAAAVRQWCPRNLFRVAFKRSRNLKELNSRSQPSPD